jgi:hypothetical protein
MREPVSERTEPPATLTRRPPPVPIAKPRPPQIPGAYLIRTANKSSRPAIGAPRLSAAPTASAPCPPKPRRAHPPPGTRGPTSRRCPRPHAPVDRHRGRRQGVGNGGRHTSFRWVVQYRIVRARRPGQGCRSKPSLRSSRRADGTALSTAKRSSHAGFCRIFRPRATLERAA